MIKTFIAPINILCPIISWITEDIKHMEEEEEKEEK